MVEAYIGPSVYAKELAKRRSETLFAIGGLTSNFKTMNSSDHPVARYVAGLLLLMLVLYLLRDFLPALGWALLLAATLWNPFKKLEERLKGRKMLAAGITTFVVAVGIAIPILWVSSLITGEMHSAFKYLEHANANGIPVPQFVHKVPFVGIALDEFWVNEFSQPNRLFTVLRQKLTPHAEMAPSLIKDVGMMVVHSGIAYFFAMLVMFFTFLHGHAIVAQVRKVSYVLFGGKMLPFLNVIPTVLRATIIGMLVVAVGEGFVLGTAYWVAGLPSPAMLGAATAVMAIVPGGAPVSMSSCALFLYSTGHGFAAMGLLSWGFFQLFMVDHFVRPRLIGASAKLPFLVVLFGLLGGLSSFGLVGLFIGPTVTALGYRVWKSLANE